MAELPHFINPSPLKPDAVENATKCKPNVCFFALITTGDLEYFSYSAKNIHHSISEKIFRPVNLL